MGTTGEWLWWCSTWLALLAQVLPAGLVTRRNDESFHPSLFSAGRSVAVVVVVPRDDGRILTANM
jgi:hypothetical protein